MISLARLEAMEDRLVMLELMIKTYTPSVSLSNQT